MIQEQKKQLQIQNINELSNVLDIPKNEFLTIAKNISAHVITKKKLIKGKERIITKAKENSRLRFIHNEIRHILLDPIPLPDSAHAYRKGRSHMTAAANLRGAPFILAFDIKKYFDGIRPKSVYTLWISLGCGADVARLLTQLTTFNYKLPQGFATSDTIANLIRADVDRRLEGLAKKLGLSYISYCDNLFLCGTYIPDHAQKLCRKVLLQSGMNIPEERFKLYDPKNKNREVLGLRVGNKLSIPWKYKRSVLAQAKKVSSIPEGLKQKEVASLRGKIGYIKFVEKCSKKVVKPSIN